MSSHRAALHTLNNTVPYHSHSMTPSAHSPVNKMAQPQRTASQDSSADGIRKRVCKACDRCRLKKSKCDGSHPCSRCKADNAICVFGERKKSHDKVYPKGYVEMLEQQQGQLVSGLQEMYRRLVSADAWKGAPLAEANGNPLTHDILAALDLLEVKHDGSGEVEAFEEDCEKLQSRLLADGAGYTSHHRRGSISSDSEHSQHSHGRSHSHGTPTISKPALFKDNFNFSSQPPTPANHSPAPSQRRSFPPPTSQPSPLQHSSPLNNDPQLYQAEWAYPEPNTKFMMRSDYAVQTPELDQSMGGLGGFGQWENTSPSFDMTQSGITSYPQLSNSFSNMPKLQDGTLGSMQMGDPMQMEMEFNQFISVIT